MKQVILIIITIFLFTSCTKKDNTIKIGLVVGTSGKYSSLGRAINDGVFLAFNQINYKINGKTIELIQKDDKQDEQIDKKVINELLNKDIKIIIGNATSSMTKVSLEIINKIKGVLLFSPTASSGEFSNKDDNFIRINGGDIDIAMQDLIKFIKLHNFKSVTIIGDDKNKAYLDTYTKWLPKTLKKQNIIKSSFQFINIDLPLLQIESKINKSSSNLVVVVANSIDSATVIQYLRQNNIKNKILCSGWANDKSFFENIGKYGEKLYFATSLEDNNNEKFQKYKKLFYKTYGKEPDKFNTKGYKTAQILIEALKECKDISRVKEYILTKKTFDTVTGKLTFNRYGDIQYKEYILQIIDGKFKKVFDE